MLGRDCQPYEDVPANGSAITPNATPVPYYTVRCGSLSSDFADFVFAIKYCRSPAWYEAHNEIAHAMQLKQAQVSGQQQLHVACRDSQFLPMTGFKLHSVSECQLLDR